MTLFDPHPDAQATEGWSRLWVIGQPHYVRGRTTLCGLSANPAALKLTPEPDKGVTERDKKTPCKHCEAKLKAAC